MCSYMCSSKAISQKLTCALKSMLGMPKGATATHCNPLQHSSTCCNTTTHTATQQTGRCARRFYIHICVYIHMCNFTNIHLHVCIRCVAYSALLLPCIRCLALHTLPCFICLAPLLHMYMLAMLQLTMSYGLAIISRLLKHIGLF